MSTLRLHLVFGGGLELLLPEKKNSFTVEIDARIDPGLAVVRLKEAAQCREGRREPKVVTPSNGRKMESDEASLPGPAPAPHPTPLAQATDIRYLIQYIRWSMITERRELFADDTGIRPGILVLVNQTDWELEGELDYLLQNEDEIVFISTLHGG